MLITGTKMLYFAVQVNEEQEGKGAKAQVQIRGQMIPTGAWYSLQAGAPKVSGASLRKYMVTATKEGRELRHLDMEPASVRATGEEKIHIELPEECHDFPGAFGRLNKSIYGWRRPRLSFNQRTLGDLSQDAGV